MAENYAFIRDAQNAHDWANYAQQGVTPVLNATDPALAQHMADARAAGLNPAIWIPAGQKMDPVTYGQQMAAVVQTYKPSAIMPNVETEGEGAAGSQWSQTMMSEFGRYVPPGSIPLSVTVEANKPQGNASMDNFDYTPYLTAGGNIIAESFVGNSGDPVDPDKVRQMLIDSGVPADKINVQLRPGQAPGKMGGAYSMYTLDDAKPGDTTRFLSSLPGPDGGPTTPPATTTDSTTDTTKPPDNTPRPDYENPAARLYAHQMLHRTGAPPGIIDQYGGDPTAAWRAWSEHLADVRATNRATAVQLGTNQRNQANVDASQGPISTMPVGTRTPGRGAPDMSAIAAAARGQAGYRTDMPPSVPLGTSPHVGDFPQAIPSEPTLVTRPLPPPESPAAPTGQLAALAPVARARMAI